MHTIRSNVFETNSSSTHSLTISKDVVPYTSIRTDYEDNIRIKLGEFGWGPYKTNDANEKASYVFTALKDDDSQFKTDIVAMIKQHAKCRGEVIIEENENAHIDHQSIGIFESNCNSIEDVKDFIFNPNSWLFIYNDNEEQHPNWFDPPNTNYKYILMLQDCSEQIKFADIPEFSKLIDSLEYLFGQVSYNSKKYRDFYFEKSYGIQNIDCNEIIIRHTKYDYDTQTSILKEEKHLSFKVLNLENLKEIEQLINRIQLQTELNKIQNFQE